MGWSELGVILLVALAADFRFDATVLTRFMICVDAPAQSLSPAVAGGESPAALGADMRLDLGQWVEAESLWGPDLAWGGYGPREDDPERRRPMEVAIGYERTMNSTQGDEFDYSSNIISTGMRFPMPLGVDFSFAAVWEWQDYWQHSLIDRQRRFRRSFIQEYVFGLERRFYLRFSSLSSLSSSCSIVANTQLARLPFTTSRRAFLGAYIQVPSTTILNPQPAFVRCRVLN